MMRALSAPLEGGIAPEELLGSHLSEGSGSAGKVEFQRPLRVYPQVIRYRGGDTSAVTSFYCASSLPAR